MASHLYAHWRDTSRPARFWLIDARAAFPFLLFLLHISFWTFGVAVVATFFFALLERYGFTLAIFRRWLRNLMAGPRKLAVPWWRRPS